MESADGAPIGSIPEKAFQTLIHLVRKSGSLIPKDELYAAVWPDAVVEENNLDKAIHTLRHALGEKTGEQKYIETVRKHGYTFVAPVERGAVPDLESGAVSNVTNFDEGRIFNFAVEPGGSRILAARAQLDKEATQIKVDPSSWTSAVNMNAVVS